MSLRRCDTEHLREYPDCYEECDHDKCVGIDLSQLSEAEAGAYEVIDGKLVKATQAISEKDGKATILQFGEVVEEEYIPIEEACAGCKHDGFKTIKKCQEQQGKDGRARGFTTVICPHQFKRFKEAMDNG